MWSRLTEVAEGLADIVAPVEGSAEAEQESELWDRFTSVVAPPASSDGPSSGQETKRPDAQALLEEDEQEQYICELERALLQRKKQNDALEAQVRELQSQPQSDAQIERQLQAKVTQLKAQLQRLQLEKGDPTPFSSATGPETDRSKLESKVTALETQLADQQAQCRALQAAMERQTTSSTTTVISDDEAGDSASTDGKTSSSLALLVQTALVLASATSSERVTIADTEADVTAQLLELAKQAKAQLQSANEQLQTLQGCVTSFVELHRDVGDGDAPDVTHSASLEATLGVLSHRLNKAATESVELSHLREKLRATGDEDDEQLKKTLQLQAQVSSLQAARQRSEKAREQLEAQEAKLGLLLEEKDAAIARLQANTAQLKASMAHLAHELQDAQTEADELAARSERQEKEIRTLQTRVKQLETANEELQDDDREVRSRAGEYEQGYMDLLAEIEKLKTQNQEEKAALLAKSEEHASSVDSQRVYDLESRLATSEADRVVALQDAERLQRNVDSLEGVLHQFQVDSKQQKKRLASAEAELEQVKKELQERMAESRSCEEEGDDLQRVMAKLAKKTHECEQLREALESTATQYNSERDVLDKRLAAQLVVAYVDSDKKGEVLQLMARMMGFSEEQKRRVGLGYPIQGNGGGGLFSSIIGLVAPSDEGGAASASAIVDPSALEGKSFADIWSEFLLEEASKGGQ